MVENASTTLLEVDSPATGAPFARSSRRYPMGECSRVGLPVVSRRNRALQMYFHTEPPEIDVLGTESVILAHSLRCAAVWCAVCV